MTWDQGFNGTLNLRFSENLGFGIIVQCNFGTKGKTEFALKLFITKTISTIRNNCTSWATHVNNKTQGMLICIFENKCVK